MLLELMAPKPYGLGFKHPPTRDRPPNTTILQADMDPEKGPYIDYDFGLGLSKKYFSFHVVLGDGGS